MVTAWLAVASGPGFHLTLNAVLAVVAIATFCLTAAGVVGVGLRIGNNTQTLANYRETAQSWKDKADAQGSQISTLQQMVSERDGEIREIKTKVALLEKMILGDSTIKALMEEHRKLDGKISKVQTGVTEILDRIPA